MTGAGTFVVETAAGRIEAEARSVNHRFLKTTLRAQGPLPGLNAVVEDVVRKAVRRGHVTVAVRYVPSAAHDGAGGIDEAAFAAAALRLKTLAARHGLGPVTAHDVLAVPGVVAAGAEARDEAALLGACQEAAEGAVAELQVAREREGALLVFELREQLDAIELAVAALAQRAAEVPAAWRVRLQRRLEDLLQGTGVAPDPAQVARECAVAAERSDVREELARLQAHLEHARSLLQEGGPVGRRMDFLAQEFHREANTVASKTSDLQLGRTVLDLRTAVERLREQVQNLE
jgi:uncharacterized protein (TIGR00255 family)